jgi:hypothetical protein
VRYRTAYNFGCSQALWDCDDNVEVMGDAAGRIQEGRSTMLVCSDAYTFRCVSDVSL